MHSLSSVFVPSKPMNHLPSSLRDKSCEAREKNILINDGQNKTKIRTIMRAKLDTEIAIIIVSVSFARAMCIFR